MSTFLKTTTISMSLVAAASSLVAAELPTDPYQSVKALVEQLAHLDYPDERLLRARDALLANGPQVVAPLVRLFNETDDDMYRPTILALLTQVEGGKADAVRLIESELAKNPSEWAGRRWVGPALILLGKTEPAKARKACVRILEVDGNKDDQFMAAGGLSRHGELDDITVLERIIERRKNRPLAEGQKVDDVSYTAEDAIRAIRERAALQQASPTVQASATTASATPSPTPTAQPIKPVGATAETKPKATGGFTSQGWFWGLGGVLVLALALWLLRRRFN